MENFALNAQHSGAINHAHSVHFDGTIVSALKEVRLAVTIIVIGWFAVTVVRALPALQSRDKDRGG